jgi:hypothetical protein
MRLGAPAPSLADAARSVAARLAPVSASATGKTLMRSRLSHSRTTASVPACNAWAKPLPSRLRTVWLKA